MIFKEEAMDFDPGTLGLDQAQNGICNGSGCDGRLDMENINPCHSSPQDIQWIPVQERADNAVHQERLKAFLRERGHSNLTSELLRIKAKVLKRGVFIIGVILLNIG